jgi:hypothetical protein
MVVLAASLSKKSGRERTIEKMEGHKTMRLVLAVQQSFSNVPQKTVESEELAHALGLHRHLQAVLEKLYSSLQMCHQHSCHRLCRRTYSSQ